VALAAADARGDTLRWKLVAEGDRCDVRSLARELTLACDALGDAEDGANVAGANGARCAVAGAGEAKPDRRAVLRCAAAGPWMIDVYDGAGRLAWTFAFDGEDRMRRAAIWIARTTDVSPPDPARAPAANENAPASSDAVAIPRPPRGP
jgi:hypothetical protein